MAGAMSNLKAMLPWFSGWFAAGCGFSLAAAVWAVCFRLDGIWIFDAVMPLVDWLNPGIDVPDNLGVAYTYLVRIGVALATLAVACFGIGLWRRARQQKAGGEAEPAS
jgi:hypothetical protein